MKKRICIKLKSYQTLDARELIIIRYSTYYTLYGKIDRYLRHKKTARQIQYYFSQVPIESSNMEIHLGTLQKMLLVDRCWYLDPQKNYY